MGVTLSALELSYPILCSFWMTFQRYYFNQTQRLLKFLNLLNLISLHFLAGYLTESTLIRYSKDRVSPAWLNLTSRREEKAQPASAKVYNTKKKTELFWTAAFSLRKELDWQESLRIIESKRDNLTEIGLETKFPWNYKTEIYWTAVLAVKIQL